MDPGGSTLEPVRRGKVKDVYEFDDELEFHYTDKISVFDKIIPSIIPDKGETLCRTSAHWFGRLEGMGIGSHFLELKAPSIMRVKRVDVIRDYSKLNAKTNNYLIPLEFISRHYIAGSLFDRIKKGKVKGTDLGFPEGHVVRYGERLPEPLFEITTKLEEFDRKVDRDEALKISGLTEDDLMDIEQTVLRIDGIIEKEVSQKGLIHVDGKKEFAFDPERKLMVVDSFGTADEDRFWELDAYKRGELVEVSKETVRHHYRSIGYLEDLERARDAGSDEPAIPPLPDKVVETTRKLYIDLFERLTGKPFR